MKTRLWPILLASFVGLVILLTLGVWQVQRLQWKEALIAQVTARMKSPPMALADVVARIGAGEDMEFTPVDVTGRFRHDKELRVISTFEGGPAWEIVTPLLTEDNHLVLINRGVAPDAVLGTLSRPDGEVTITGLVRQRPPRKGFFDPANDAAANRWYWWDAPAMVSAAGATHDLKVAPFVLEESPIGPQTSFPQPQPVVMSFRNNHLGYAITWFGLASVLLVMTGLFIRSRTKDG